MEDDDGYNIFKIYVFFMLLLMIVGGIVAIIEKANESRIESEAIKAGLHQEVVDGQKVWVK